MSACQYLFPLLFLVLRHHSRIIRLASRALIDQEELQIAARTVQQVLDIALGRAEVLNGRSTKTNTTRIYIIWLCFAAVFRQKYVFAESESNLLDRVAFGMVCQVSP